MRSLLWLGFICQCFIEGAGVRSSSFLSTGLSSAGGLGVEGLGLEGGEVNSRNGEELLTNQKKTTGRTYIDRLTSSYYILDINRADIDENKRESDGQDGGQNPATERKMRTVVVIEQQAKRKTTGDDCTKDDDEINSEDDSDFEVVEDSIEESDEMFFEDDEEEEDKVTKQLGEGGGGDGVNDNEEADSKDAENNDENDSDDTVNEETGTINTIAALKKIWKDTIRDSYTVQQTTKSHEIQSALAALVSLASANTSSASVNASASSNINTDSDSNKSLQSLMSLYPSLLRSNGTSRPSFHRQLEAQFIDPVAVGGRALWMDQEFALILKGAAVLAQHPELTSYGGRPSRGVKLDSPSSSHVMQIAVVQALTRSLGSTMVTLNRKTIEKVRKEGLAKQLPIALLSTVNLISSLLDEVEEEGSPVVLALTDDLQWLTGSQATSEVLIEELKSLTSKVFVIVIKPEAEVKVGQSASSIREERTKSPTPEPVSQPQGFPNFANMFQNQMPMSGFSFPPPQPQIRPDSNENKDEGPEITPGPSFPPQGMTFGRSFQVSIQNGSATMTPIPSPIGPGSFPGGPEGANFPNEAMLRRMMEQRMAQNQGQGPAPTQQMPSPPFPPDLSEEELQEFLSKPENQPAMKEFLDRLMQMAMSQLPPGMGMEMTPNGLQGPNGENPQMEVKVHMMSIPIGMMPGGPNMPPNMMPQGMIPPKNPSLSGEEMKEIERERREDKESKREGMRGLPGLSFFKNIRGKKIKDNNIKNKKMKTMKRTKMNLSVIDGRKSGAEKGRNSEESREITNSGKELLSILEIMALDAPRDQGLRVLWDQMVDEEIGKKIAKKNSKVLIRELGKLSLWFDERDSLGHLSAMGRGPVGSKVLRALDDVLQKQLLSEAEVKSAVSLAVRLQAGRYDPTPPLYIPPSVTVERGGEVYKEGDSVAVAGGGEELVSGEIASESASESENDSVSSSLPTPATPTVTTTSTTTHSPSTPVTTPKSKLYLSHWAIDTALSAIIKGPSPRLGKPSARSKDEISAMVTDKHERALIGNVITPQDIGITYDMIGGLADVKETLRQCVTYPLKYPRLYQEGVAAEAVKGVLLFGPPGTGKTMLAKAVATEGGATFLTVDASTIENKWLGESEKNAKAVFTLARRLAPCVVYLDEVDSVLSSRERGDDSSHGTLTSVKTTLMQEWDGLRTGKDRVVVIASTNRPFDLDEAVLRRLPRRIMVDLPDCATRADILAVTLSANRIGPDVNLTTIAESLEGYTGSDIKEVCREAVVRVAHERAHALESGGRTIDGVKRVKDKDSDEDEDPLSPLRPVNTADFKLAIKKLKASVDDSGKEIQKVQEWNEKYGEVKKSKKGKKNAGAHMSLYI